MLSEPRRRPRPAGATPAAADSGQWRCAGRRLAAKTIAELAYEEVLAPVALGEPGAYRVDLPGGVAYTFRARRGPFGTWRIAPDSLLRRAGGATGPGDDPVRLFVDIRDVLGLDGAAAAEVVREVLATQAADARLAATALPAAALADLPYAQLEGHLDGHPCMAVNKGRLGFSASDAARYTPEARRPFRLPWIAVHRDLAAYRGVVGLGASRLLDDELGPPTRARFAAVLAAAVDDPSAYVWLPTHPWHLDEVVLPLFAPYLADGRVVVLGEAPDRYLPLQSVRTLANADHPRRRDVKVALLVRNTLVWRGLPPQPTAAAPEVTGWLRGLVGRDPFLRDECGFVPLGEVASAAVTNPLFGDMADAPYRYHELLGTVWREPVAGLLRPGERARSLASLLHVDPWGRSLLAELVARSGLAPAVWLGRLLDVLLPPLLHFLYRYGVAFCPHGENTVVVYDPSDVPVRVAVKDLAEDVNLLPDPLEEYADLPPAAAATLLRWDAGGLRHAVLSAVFAGHFRFLGAVVEDHLGVPEPRLWDLVAATVAAYQRRFPDLADRFALFALDAPSFPRVCLNREHLLGGGFHDRAGRDEQFDLCHGEVPNPLHRGGVGAGGRRV